MPQATVDFNGVAKSLGGRNEEEPSQHFDDVNLFDHDSASLAIDPPHGIDEEHQKAPDSHKRKVPRRTCLIVSGGGTMAARAGRAASPARPDRNQDTLVVG